MTPRNPWGRIDSPQHMHSQDEGIDVGVSSQNHTNDFGTSGLGRIESLIRFGRGPEMIPALAKIIFAEENIFRCEREGVGGANS